MSKTNNSGSWTGLVLKFTGCFTLVLLGVGAACYGMGWLTFGHDDQTDATNIEIETGAIKDAASDTIKSGKEILDDAGDAIEGVVEETNEASSS